MRQKIFAILIAFVFLFSQVILVDAKGFSGGRSSSFSSGSRSFSSSKSYSGSSSKSYSGSTTKSSGGYSGSSKSSSSSGDSSRSIPGSYSGSKSSSSTMKNSYMEENYKQQASKNSYNTYKQNLNDAQKKAYDSSFNNSYNVNNKMNFEDAMGSRTSRMSGYGSRPVRMNVNNYYFGGPLSYGSGFIGIWDLWFLMRASDLFWYHHWSEISPYRDHFDSAQFAEMESRVKALEAQNITKDPSYLEEGVDPDLQFSNDYQQKHLDSIYYTNKSFNPIGSIITMFVVIGVIVVILLFIFRKVSRRKPKRGFESRIY